MASKTETINFLNSELKALAVRKGAQPHVAQVDLIMNDAKKVEQKSQKKVTPKKIV